MLDGVDAALDTDHYLLRVGGVFRKVLFEKMQAVVTWSAVEFSTVPEIGTGGEGGLHGFDSFRGRCGIRAPVEACSSSDGFQYRHDKEEVKLGETCP